MDHRDGYATDGLPIPPPANGPRGSWWGAVELRLFSKEAPEGIPGGSLERLGDSEGLALRQK